MTLLHCAHGVSAARSFVQIASRGYSVAAAQSTGPLEFLMPRRTGVALSLPARSSKRYGSDPISLSIASRLAGCFAQRTQSRFFAASALHYATRCSLNPRKDDDGNEMMLEMTPRAAKRLSEIMKKDDNPNLALRIRVESGGCHGFQYLMSLVTIPGKDAQEWPSTVDEEDSIFQYFPDDAATGPQSHESPKIILDEPSLELLKGSKVDFTMELIGSQFKIVDNPYATSSCGCGSSFDIKM